MDEKTDNGGSQARLLVSLGTVIGLMTLGLAAARFAAGDQTAVPAIFVACSAVFFAAAAVARWTRATQLAAVVLPLAGWLGTFGAAVVEGGLASDAVLWMPFVPLLATLTLQARGAAIPSALAFASPVVLLFLASEMAVEDFLRAFAATGAVGCASIVGRSYQRNKSRALRRIHAKQHVLQQMVENVPTGIAVVLDDGTIEVVNRRFARMLGIAREPSELVGVSVDALHSLANQLPADAKLFKPTDGTTRIVLMNGAVLERTLERSESDAGTEGYVLSLHDVTVLHTEHSDAITRLETDELTGVASRSHLLELLDVVSNAGEPFGVFFVDLDGFKSVNDTHGHEAGDQVLQAVASRLRGAVRSEDVVGRLGGDEFLVIGRGAATAAQIAALAEKLRQAAGVPTSIGAGDVEVSVSASVGAVPGGRDASEAVRLADVAMYVAKRAGKDRCHVESAPRR